VLAAARDRSAAVGPPWSRRLELGRKALGSPMGLNFKIQAKGNQFPFEACLPTWPLERLVILEM
jgi:hypothetical protein